MPAGNREQKFFTALRDVFIGAKVEGESGYINLMRIKSRYYETGVFPKLLEDISVALKPFPQFREELFDKLYTFFSRYFSESGSIYFARTRYHDSVYERVYTDDKDVILFWKTHMLYYVKTDRLFQNLEVELPACRDEGGAGREGQKFFFDVSGLEHKKANEKRELIYEFKERRRDLSAGQAGGALVFTVAYSERGRKTNTTDILRALKKVGVAVTEELLERAFRVFERQSEVDYFINKNAKAFLEEQSTCGCINTSSPARASGRRRASGNCKCSRASPSRSSPSSASSRTSWSKSGTNRSSSSTPATSSP